MRWQADALKDTNTWNATAHGIDTGKGTFRLYRLQLRRPNDIWWKTHRKQRKFKRRPRMWVMYLHTCRCLVNEYKYSRCTWRTLVCWLINLKSWCLSAEGGMRGVKGACNYDMGLEVKKKKLWTSSTWVHFETRDRTVFINVEHGTKSTSTRSAYKKMGKTSPWRHIVCRYKEAASSLCIFSSGPQFPRRDCVQRKQLVKVSTRVTYSNSFGCGCCSPETLQQ